jgi:tetratricopeptide (TPR) repeat protein
MPREHEDRIDALLEAVEEAMGCVPQSEWRAIVRRAFANEDVAGVLWRGQRVPDHPDLRAALDQYRGWKKALGAIALGDGSAFERDFWRRLARGSGPSLQLLGMGAAGKVYAGNLMGEVVSLFVHRQRTEAEELNDAGFSHHHAGGYEEALRLHERALQIAADFPLAWINKGIALKNLGRLDEAIACYDQVIDRLDKDSKKAWYNKAVALRLQGKTQQAIECLNRALEIDPHYDLARRLREECRGSEREVSVARMEANLPQDPQAMRLLAMATNLASQGNHEAAARLYEQALSHEPGNAALLTALGETLCECGRFDQAEARLREALAKDEELGTAWLNLVRCLVQRRDLQAALEAADKAVKYAPDDSMAWANRAAVQYNLQQYAAALASARRSLELDGRNPFGMFYAGFSLFFLERYREARDTLQRLVRMAPDFQGVPIARDMMGEIDRILS